MSFIMFLPTGASIMGGGLYGCEDVNQICESNIPLGTIIITMSQSAVEIEIADRTIKITGSR